MTWFLGWCGFIIERRVNKKTGSFNYGSVMSCYHTLVQLSEVKYISPVCVKNLADLRSVPGLFEKQTIYFHTKFCVSVTPCKFNLTKYHMMEPNFERPDIMVIGNSIFLENKIFMSIRFMIVFNLIEEYNKAIVFG